ncbi:hypothetical protein [Homoserinimonas hongtaonis]|uniref:Uncharacterized protein n=1 Tax=Homoserinimonas hongtaonis TaxID=2079791 RepID=A0A2U1T1C0_9MICO|nr:hypothetical protein [Salinibacterium hongtaonis]PWB97672.1 hypothetical protein DF220_07395 [Salinibacterium hongtaonis]
MTDKIASPFERRRNIQPSLHAARRRIRSTSALSIASVFALVQLSRWGLFGWQPPVGKRSLLAILADPARTSLKPRTVALLIEAGMLEASAQELTITEAGHRVVAEHADLFASPADAEHTD